MTRINIGIPPATLHRQHLIAEYRELPRMIALAHARGSRIPDVPFTLNAGHMLSCVRYGAHLAERHQALVAEMLRRGYRPSMPAVRADQFPEACRNSPTQAWIDAARPIVLARIQERLGKLNQ
jgi:deoxyribonuclease (pyrimidine dimer)